MSKCRSPTAWLLGGILRLGRRGGALGRALAPGRGSTLHPREKGKGKFSPGSLTRGQTETQGIFALQTFKEARGYAKKRVWRHLRAPNLQGGSRLGKEAGMEASSRSKPSRRLRASRRLIKYAPSFTTLLRKEVLYKRRSFTIFLKTSLLPQK